MAHFGSTLNVPERQLMTPAFSDETWRTIACLQGRSGTDQRVTECAYCFNSSKHLMVGRGGDSQQRRHPYGPSTMCIRRFISTALQSIRRRSRHSPRVRSCYNDAIATIHILSQRHNQHRGSFSCKLHKHGSQACHARFNQSRSGRHPSGAHRR